MAQLACPEYFKPSTITANIKNVWVKQWQNLKENLQYMYNIQKSRMN